MIELAAGAAALGILGTLHGLRKHLYIDRETLAAHVLLCGDTRTGKSTVIRQFLHYAKECGDAALVLDSKMEFIPEFYEPAKNDRILSPKDDRCPYMHLGRECLDKADALSVLRAVNPAHPDSPQSRFFDDHAAKIAAHIVWHYQPDYQTYGRWLQQPDVFIYPKLVGTQHEVTLNTNAAPQKAGLDGTLNECGVAMAMMPGVEEGRPEFSFLDWARDRDGWLFLPNPANLREALRPLISAWVDMAIRRVMSSTEQKRRVWIVLDEADTLNALPVIVEAITQMACTGNPMILGVQGLAQLTKYGQAGARIIASQPASKIILATSDGDSKRDLSNLIGESLFRRYRTTSGKGSSSSGPEEFPRALVMPGEVGAMKNLQGILVHRGDVTKFKLRYKKPVMRESAYLERIIPELPPPVKKPEKTEKAVEDKPEKKVPKRAAPAKDSANTEYRLLEPGEPFEIGDEYQNEDGYWQVLSEDEYREGFGFRDHYDPSEGMGAFRRPPNKPEELVRKTREINPASGRLFKQKGKKKGRPPAV